MYAYEGVGAAKAGLGAYLDFYNDPRPQSPTTIAERIRQAQPYVPAERLMIAPDCGMKYLTREVAYRKLEAMVRGAALVRETLV
ncbi:MAG: hypothetical protein IH861_10050 [Chloroflexi bacterium]|nr:hypothetical protein [Chloroflexota bacterium]